MEDHIPERPDRKLLIGRQTSKWSLWDVVFHENNSTLHFRSEEPKEDKSTFGTQTFMIA